jgi:DNA adenine methylase
MVSDETINPTVSESSERTPKPFLKWAGGKAQLVKAISEFIPKQFNRYWEPFIGGGALFFALRPQKASLSDINSELINTYTVVRDSVGELITELKTHVYTEEHFYEVRGWDRRIDFLNISPVKRAARFIYLNKCCFNGLHRVNSKGYFNVPFGQYSNPKIVDEVNLYACSRALSGVDLSTQSYLSIEQQVEEGDLVYFDPPYVPVSDTAYFTSYTQEGFSFNDQIALRDLCARLVDKGAHIILSNAESPFIEKLYQGFKINSVFATRAINSKASSRGEVGEFIVTG